MGYNTVRMTDKRPDQHQKGFTLTEVIVSLAVFGIVAAAIVGMINFTQEAQRNEVYLSAANTAAKQIIEEARDGQYDVLIPGQTYDKTALVPDTLPSRSASLTVSASTSMPDLKRLDVRVAYKVGVFDRHVDLSAIIGKGGIAQ
jgi:prepilin-type N-terminal cleavage/methylation domain-containing protein